MSGITNIIGIIESKAEEKVTGIIREAELQKEQTIKDAKKKAESITQQIVSKAKIESDAELARQEASAKLKAKYKVLEAKEAVMKEILATAEEDLKKQVKSSEYESVITKLAIAGATALNEDTIELILPKGQEKTVNVTGLAKSISDEIGKKVSVSISKDTIRASGGLIIRNQHGTKWVDNTFEARFERLESKIRDEISTILFEEQK
ncbi:MAG: V-type ATP synthase subunit E [Candidatus Thorarchaeota archaeon]